jgi:hypothetical protein
MGTENQTDCYGAIAHQPQGAVSLTIGCGTNLEGRTPEYGHTPDRLIKAAGRHEGARARFGANVGERNGQPHEDIKAPFFLNEGDGFLCFYTSAGARLMESTDVASYRRKDLGDGRGDLLFPDSGRDIMVLKVDDVYHAYSTITTRERTSYVQLKTSSEFLTWSKPKVVSQGGRAGNGPVSSESPFVVERDGWFYLFRASSTTFKTCVYRSPDPTDFGRDVDRYFITEFDVKAPEIIRDGDREYISDLGDFQGIRIAPLEWKQGGSASAGK